VAISSEREYCSRKLWVAGARKATALGGTNAGICDPRVRAKGGRRFRPGPRRTDRAGLAAGRSRRGHLRVEQQLVTEKQLADAAPLPAVKAFGDYLTERAQEQAKWHRGRIAQHERRAKRLRFWQLAATAAGTVLAAVAGAVQGSHLTAWTAAATTVAAALAAHVAATQHERIASSYAATVDQLDRLIAAVDLKTESADRQAQFVADVERVLATQNEGWTDLLSPSARKRS
jgi:hypothetical protein